MTLQEISSLEVYKFETPTEVNSVEYFVHKNNLEHNVRAFRFLEDYIECDFEYGDCIITCVSSKGYRYNHVLNFFCAKL